VIKVQELLKSKLQSLFKERIDFKEKKHNQEITGQIDEDPTTKLETKDER
jgi:hypothetical protein